jgi:hypothetical protein
MKLLLTPALRRVTTLALTYKKQPWLAPDSDPTGLTNMADHWLANFLSMEGLIQHHTLRILSDFALKLRCVSQAVKVSLETNRGFVFNLVLSERGIDELTAEFLLVWNGIVNLCCRDPWTPSNKWYSSFMKTFFSNRAMKYGKLELRVKGQHASDLLESLNYLIHGGGKIQSFWMVFEGNLRDFIATEGRLTILKHALAEGIQLSLVVRDSKKEQVRSFFNLCQGSGIDLTDLTLR